MTTTERLDLIDAVVYGDAFDCAVTLDELWRFSRVAIGRDELVRRLRADRQLSSAVLEQDGLYCLHDRRELLARRRSRLARAERLRRRGRRLASALRHVPFVRGIALTGSAAAADAGSDADVDLLVLVAAERLATVFVLLGASSRLLGRRVFCPNYYLCCERLEIEPGTAYVARELAQARPLSGDPAALLAANPWVLDVFPNLAAPAGRSEPRPVVQRFVEAALRTRVGDAIEAWALGVTLRRLRAHHALFGQDVPPDVLEALSDGVALRFHGEATARRTLARYERRRSELAARLEARAEIGSAS